ncbi:EVE domain-containing protein [Paenibacillus donghaensis]|uniref:EVE domain-containing protein n=1 Tax=Paenibacillus donghaensis TaxID=414771 RepID=UPI0018840D69|nr:EVE domain-containing protein [Paenibacillus donghaensis]MBE9918109.1 EVE domain-containing protein [Paenibacillus donghaensis]
MKGGQALQSFTAIGQVVDDEVYRFKMREDFVPYRRNIRYFPCHSVRIAGLFDKLSFTKGKVSWGYSFRFGQQEISQEDIIIIANEMLGEGWEEALPLS